MADETRVRVNRAPVLTLWAAVVAERLGMPPDTALSLASVVAGTAARAKARRLGLAEERGPEDLREAVAPHRVVRLLGKDIRVKNEAGTLLAVSDGRAAPAAPVDVYLTKAFGGHLPAVREAMAALAMTLPPDELNRVGFRLYERFRPEVPEGVTGWGAKGELHLWRISGAAE